MVSSSPEKSKPKIVNNEDIYKVKTKEIAFRRTNQKSTGKRSLLPETWIKSASNNSKTKLKNLNFLTNYKISKIEERAALSYQSFSSL